MNQEYLWNKTGSDPEIEELENALAVFRCKEIAPPELPAKVLPFTKFTKKETLRGYVRFAFAAAACLTFVAISLGVWFQISKDKTINLAQTTAPPDVVKSSDETFIKNPEVPPIEKIKKPKRKVEKIRKNAPANTKQSKPIARQIKTKKPADGLTKREKYAYDQLMLALSITGSKLNLVKEKIEGN